MTLKVLNYKAKPLNVEAIYYDGTETMAEELCKEYPKSFLVGRDKDDNFAGLYILIPLAGGKCDMMAVAPDDVLYREPDGQIFCSVDDVTFSKYFIRTRARNKNKLIIATEMPEEV